MNATEHDMMEARTPWWWSYAEFLQTELHRSESDAWSTICSDAFAYFASFATRNASKDFLTFREVELVNLVKTGKTVDQLLAEGVL